MSADNRSNYKKVLRWLLVDFQLMPESVKEQFNEGGFVAGLQRKAFMAENMVTTPSIYIK